MVIEKINEVVYKISLNQDELLKYGISFDDLNYNDLSTKLFFTALIEKIKGEINIDIQLKNVFIESFPDADKGCILYLNLNKRSFNEYKTYKKVNNSCHYCFHFKSLNNLIGGCNLLSQHFNVDTIKSDLFCNNKEYYLIIDIELPDFIKLKGILCEFGELIKADKYYYLHISSQYNLICQNHALDTIAKNLV